MNLRPPESAPNSSFVLEHDEVQTSGSIAAPTVPADSVRDLQPISEPTSLPATSIIANNQHSLADAAEELEPCGVQQHNASAAATHNVSQHPQQISPKPPQTTAIADILDQLSNNESAIRTAEEVLEHLLLKQSALMQLEQHMEQQLVISAISRPLGFHRGRPVAALLLLRCMQQWGALTAAESPVLDQLLLTIQQQLVTDDESAPAELAGLQGHVAHWLTVSAVLYCLLLKTTNPHLAAAAAAAAQQVLGQHSHKSTAAAVVTAAKKRAGELQQQLTERFRGWGQHQQQQQGREKGGQLGGWFKGWGQQQQQQQAVEGDRADEDLNQQDSAAADAADAAAEGRRSADVAAAVAADVSGADDLAAASTAAAAAAAAEGRVSPPPAAAAPLQRQGTGASSISTGSSYSLASLSLAAAAAAGSGKAAAAGGGHAAVQGFMSGLDQIVQRCFVTLRDQLKRRLAPLLADCMLMTDADGYDGFLGGGNILNQGLSQQQQQQEGDDRLGDGSAAAAAVAGAAVASGDEAEAALMVYKCWSEVVGVFHAALVALREAGVPQTLTADLMQQVLEFMNVQLFNQLLLRPECCRATNARAVLRGLKQLDGWILHEQHAAAAASSSTQQQQRGTTAGAAAAGSSEPGWEDVAVDNEFDNWQPLQQQRWRQQQQPKQQQQQQHEFHDVGPGAWEALSHVRQALQFLVLDHKGALSYDDLADHICPALSHQQLYRLCTTAWTNTPEQDGCVSGELLEEMKKRHTLSTNGGLIVTYLLDEPIVLPFVQQSASGSTAAASSTSFFSRGIKEATPAASDAAGDAEVYRGRCKASAVVLWDDMRDYGAGIPIPGVLLEGGCPASVFAFLEDDKPWPPHGR